jgi:hypothetical protein
MWCAGGGSDWQRGDEQTFLLGWLSAAIVGFFQIEGKLFNPNCVDLSTKSEKTCRLGLVTTETVHSTDRTGCQPFLFSASNAVGE